MYSAHQKVLQRQASFDILLMCGNINNRVSSIKMSNINYGELDEIKKINALLYGRY